MAGESADRLASAQRRLAVEIRSWKFGFVMIDGCRLLEWGNCRFGSGNATGAIRKFAFLLNTYAPSVVITRSPRRTKHQSSRIATLVFQKLREEANIRSVKFVVLKRMDVQEFFRRQGRKNKNAVAEIVTARFEEMKEKRPKVRKLWDSEPNPAAVFDAAATTIAYDGLKQQQA